MDDPLFAPVAETNGWLPQVNTVNMVTKAWDDTSINPDQAIAEILDCLYVTPSLPPHPCLSISFIPTHTHTSMYPYTGSTQSSTTPIQKCSAR